MQNLKNIYKYMLVLLAASALATLASCGNGGTPKAAATSSGIATAATIQLLVSSQQMPSSSIASVVLTAVVLDGSGQAITGKTIAFSKGTDTSSYFSGITALTTSSGVATATLNIGSDMANRVINVSATADGAVGTNVVTVAGTKISVSGNTSLALTASTTLTMIVKDSTGVAVPGVILAVASANGNPIVLTPSTGMTDSTGQITAAVTATNAGTGSDVLTVTGAGATQTQTLIINSASFNFTAPVIVPPATTPEILVNTATPISIQYMNPGAISGAAISFYSSRGTITGSPAITDGSGIATVTLLAPSTGATIITATAAGGTPAATLNVVLVTSTASSLAIQANPGTVAVNTGGSTAKQSVISVVVRDSANNLVKNAHIVFTIATDASGGSLAANTAVTDISGAASVNYIAGTTFTGPNGVKIDATVDSVNNTPITPITASAYLTVASQSLYVRLATDNKIYPDTPVIGTHTKQFTALVTDAAGNPAPDGTEVRFALRPPALATPTVYAFYKGYYSWSGTAWDQTITASCVNEDANGNGTLDSGEDTNANGRLDPQGSATVNATATTISGFAIAKIAYAKDFATWVVEDLEARAGTVGNDPPSIARLLLTGAAPDYTTQTVAPPGVSSPFGISASCANVL